MLQPEITDAFRREAESLLRGGVGFVTKTVSDFSAAKRFLTERGKTKGRVVVNLEITEGMDIKALEIQLNDQQISSPWEENANFDACVLIKSSAAGKATGLREIANNLRHHSQHGKGAVVVFSEERHLMDMRELLVNLSTLAV